MKASLKTLLITLGLTVSATVSAANSWRNNLTITGIYNIPTGGFLLFFAPGTDPACGPSGNLFNILPGQNQVNADGAKAALSIALTAFTLGKTVNIYYDNTIGNCPVQIVWMNPT